MRPEAAPDARKLRIGGFVFDPRSGEIEVPGQRALHRLRPRAAKLLHHLAEHPGHLVSRGDLQQLLWGDRFVDAEQGLNACVRDVRRALVDRAAEPRLIETLPGRGYRLIVPVAKLSTVRQRRVRAAAALVVAALLVGGATLVGLASHRQGRPPNAPVNHEAGTLMLEAEHLAKIGDADALSRSVRLLEEALDLDPGFAPALGKLAQVSFLRGDLEAARASAERALALDPDLAEAHAAVGFLDFYQGKDRRRAERHLVRAVRLDPSSATSRQALAHYLIANGRPDRAVEEIHKALELDPVDARLRGDAGWIFYWARRFPEAADHARRTLILAPDDDVARVCLFRSQVADGQAEAVDTLVELARRADLSAEVRAGFESGTAEERLHNYWRHVAATPTPSPRRLLALAQLGRGDDAARELTVLSESVPAFEIQHLLLDPLLDPVRSSISPLQPSS